MFPAEVKQGSVFLLHLSYCKQVSFLSSIWFPFPFFFSFVCFLLMILLFRMVLQSSAEVLCSVPKCKKAVMCLIEEICVLDKFVLA